MQKIKSKIVELPPIWLIENEDDFKQLPLGLPYIIGKKRDYDFIRIFLEYQVLYKSCLKSNLSIDWLDCLRKLGYKKCRNYTLQSGGTFIGGNTENYSIITIEDFIEDQYIVNIDKLQDLKILPSWLDDLKSNIQTNIVHEVFFNPTSYNKQMGLNVGGPTVKSIKKNLIINDVSGSIPNGVVLTISNLAKTLSKRFYADVIVTGGRSYFIDYEKVIDTDIVELARKAGRNNEGEMFREIMKEHRDYGTVISFGDDDNPGNYLTEHAECNFTCENLYSFHTDKYSNNITGYARWLKPTNKTVRITNWIDTII